MASTISRSTVAQAARLEERIKKHKEEVARLRQEIGDPEEALSTFVRDRFERQAFVPDERPARDVNADAWENDDDSDGW